MTDEEVIASFHGLYSGGRAQQLRDAGSPNAMPPWAEVYWLGRQVVKCPMDLWVYQEILFETRPEIILETGTSGGGSAYFFATLFDLFDGPGAIVTVDPDSYPHLQLPHPRVTYLFGDSTSDVITQTMRERCAGRRTMVSLDSLHTYEHVSRELELYAPLVTPGCYIVVEDTGMNDKLVHPDDVWASRAAAEFLRDNPGYQADVSREKHLLTSNRNGWIRRLK